MYPAEALFWLAALLVGYTYAGYPALLLVWRHVRSLPDVRKDWTYSPRVSVIIVAYNEEARIGAKIENCLSFDYPPDRLGIVVVSDGSTDRTEAIVEKFASRGVQLVRVPGPNGKPSALSAAVPRVDGEVLLLCDTRQRLEPLALRELVANLSDATVGAVSGALHIRTGDSATAEGVGLYWRFEKWLRETESRTASTIGVTGAIYAVRRDLFPTLDPRTILDDVAVPMHVARSGKRVVFEPSAVAWDEPTESARLEFRRKVRTLAGCYQLVALDPNLLHPGRNPLLIGFVSHKLLRLMVPWSLLAVAASSIVLASAGSPLYMLALAGQAGFYALALAGHLLPSDRRRPRLLAVPYALVLLNVAAAAALPAFALGRSRAAWKNVQ
jgi:cellulose synthase/poly-beta-1,6-N-acetylglucosamine synthase-like glycosyltransferase